MVAVIIGREFAVTDAAQPGLRARRGDAGVAARQDQDGRAGGGDPRADPGAGGIDGERTCCMSSGRSALWVVVVAALVSAADYFRRFNVVLNPRVADIPSRANSGRIAKRDSSRPETAAAPYRNPSDVEISRPLTCAARRSRRSRTASLRARDPHQRHPFGHRHDHAFADRGERQAAASDDRGTGRRACPAPRPSVPRSISMKSPCRRCVRSSLPNTTRPSDVKSSSPSVSSRSAPAGTTGATNGSR